MFSKSTFVRVANCCVGSCISVSKVDEELEHCIKTLDTDVL